MQMPRVIRGYQIDGLDTLVWTYTWAGSQLHDTSCMNRPRPLEHETRRYKRGVCPLLGTEDPFWSVIDGAGVRVKLISLVFVG